MKMFRLEAISAKGKKVLKQLVGQGAGKMKVSRICKKPFKVEAMITDKNMRNTVKVSDIPSFLAHAYSIRLETDYTFEVVD